MHVQNFRHLNYHFPKALSFPEILDFFFKLDLVRNFYYSRQIYFAYFQTSKNFKAMYRNKLQALHYYASRNRYFRVQSLINEGVDLEGKNSSGLTALMLAAENCHKEVVELLINSGADIHCVDVNDNWTLLHIASYRGSVKIVKCLVNNGIALDKKNYIGETPLMLAAERSWREIVEVLINSGADIHCCDNEGWTVLHHASSEGSVEVVQCLLNKRVALDKKNSIGETPLIMAAKRPRREIFEVLIDFGADIHCCDDEGWTVLHHASFEGSVEIVQCLVNKRVALDMKNSKGKTPLMLAAERSWREIVEVLINSGADIHCCDDEGWTLLHYASAGGLVKVMECFLSNGVPLDKKDFCGRTPLMVAAGWSRREAVEMLINSEADIHCCDDCGMTVLHHAVCGQSMEIVQCLVMKEVALDKKMRDNGSTPLHLAAKMMNMEIFDYILNAGADCNLEDDKGESPFNFLFKQESPNVCTIKLCIEKGAFVKSTDYKKLLEDPLLKKAVLQDVKLCTQAVINKFNNKDLYLLYKKLASAPKLPHIDKMKIGNGSGMALKVEQDVTHEIQAKGFCNVFEMVPLVLGILCVKSYIEKSLPVFNGGNPSESQNSYKKRLRSYNKQEYPCKRKCNL